MNEEVSKESIRFAFHYGAKPTARVLVRALKAYLAHRANKRNMPIRGKQSVKQLVQQNQGVTSLEVSGESMRQFKKIAGKYGVDFAIVKDKLAGKDKPRYTVFFKARDTDAIQAVLDQYTKKIVKKNEREGTSQHFGEVKKVESRDSQET